MIPLRIAHLAGILGLLIAACATSTPDRKLTEPGTHFVKMDIHVGVFRRSYRVHVPRQYSPNTPMPLVVVIHGAFATAEEIEAKTGFSILSDREGFIVVYPNGMGIFGLLQHWNAGHCCGRAAKIDVDDVGFLQSVIEEVSGLLNVDRSRVYMVGHSNGGMLTYRFAAERPEQISAAAAVAASIGSWTEGEPLAWEMPLPKQPVPFIIFHGTADESVPYAGGVSLRKGGDRHYVSVSDSVRFWLQANSCEEPGSREYLRRGAVTVESWTSPESGPCVRLYSLQNWGHAWPGVHLTRTLLDNDPLKDFNIAEIIWNFFQTIRSDPSRSLTGSTTSLTRIFHELLSRDRETGNPLVADAACGAGLSGAQRARNRWVCHRATTGCSFDSLRTGGSEAYLNGTSQGPTLEDARKEGHIRGRSR